MLAGFFKIKNIMPIASPAQFQKSLLTWFDQHGRKDLPWQKNKTPYRVWVSEIMLQQTQVNTVIPYYERFMKTLPSLKHLANATEDEVLHLWTGLGYYSRARNLHRAAQKIQTELKGQFPDTLEGINALPGVGLSSTGAILSIAFKQKATILDGNVKRVLSRYIGLTDPINLPASETLLWDTARRYTPAKRVEDYTQAIMDLGATLCTRSKPQCGNCPLQKTCEGYALGVAASIPRKTASKAIPTKKAAFLLIEHDGHILLEKRPAKGIWGGLYVLPQLENAPSLADIKKFCADNYAIKVKSCEVLETFRHTFTHFHLECSPHRVVWAGKKLALDSQTQVWYNPLKPKTLGLPKPIISILRSCLK